LKWREKKKAFDGQIFWLLILLYAMIRFLVEMVRGDPRGSLFYGLLSTSQGIGIFLGILSLFMLFYLRIKQRR
jgi:phosphatidylglycerol:prolipoprotein diacylglycerol transferase